MEQLVPRQAPVPPKGFVVPKAVSENGLVVMWKADGETTSRTIDLSGWAGTVRLRQQAAHSLANRTAKTGTWRSAEGNRPLIWQVKRLLAWCEAESIAQFEDFTDRHWDAYVDLQHASSPDNAVNYLTGTKQFLLDVADLPQRSRWRVAGRLGSPPTRGEQDTYSRDEFMALQDAAQRVVSKAHRRVTRNYVAALDDSGQDDRHAAMLALLDDSVERSDQVLRKRLGPPTVDVGTSVPFYLHHLFLTQEEVLAAAVLLTCHEGYNLSTLVRLTVPDRSASQGDQDLDFATVLNDKRRRRRLRYFTSVLEDSGEDSVGRAFRLVEEATIPARHYLAARGFGTNVLLLSASHGAVAGSSSKTGRGITNGVAQGVTPGGGGNAYRERSWWLPSGVEVNFQKLHRTFQTVINRAPTHNTRATHTTEYLMKNAEAKADAQWAAREGQTQAVQRADERLVLRLADDADVASDIADGGKDTATAACKDIHHHPLTGEECHENFLMCLMCTNAVATPRHLPRLVLLHQALDDLRSTLTARAWERWEDHFIRLEAFLYLRAHLTEQGRLAALAAATDRDREHVRRLLGGTYDARS